MTGELQAGVHVVEVPLGDRISRLYLFTGRERTMLFDTGCAGDIPRYVVPYLASIGTAREAVTHVVVSHCDVDHFGGLGDAQHAFPRARRVAHALDAPTMQVEVYLESRAREFAAQGLDEPPSVIAWTRASASAGSITDLASDGDLIDLGERSVQVLHVPGHSRGHLAIWDGTTGVLAVSDAVLGEHVPTADGSPSFPPTYRHPVDYLRTVKRLHDLDFDVLGTAHYPDEGSHSGRDLLDRSEAFAAHLEERLLDALVEANAPRTLRQLVEALGPVVGDWPLPGRSPALAQPVMGHLEDLAERGVVVRLPGTRDRWAATGPT